MASLKMAGKARRSVLVDHAQLEANARVSIFTTLDSLLIQYRTIEDELGMSGPTLITYLTIGLSSIQKSVRQCPIPPDFRSFEPVPMHSSGFISRRAIAAASGLPRETVRRIVDGLIADGRVVSVGRSGVCTPPGTLRRDGYFLTQLTLEVARSATILLQHGVLTLDGQRELDERLGAHATGAARAPVATPF